MPPDTTRGQRLPLLQRKNRGSDFNNIGPVLTQILLATAYFSETVDLTQFRKHHSLCNRQGNHILKCLTLVVLSNMKRALVC